MWQIPWQTLMRMMTDLPRQIEAEKVSKPAKELTPQSADEFRAFIKRINKD